MNGNKPTRAEMMEYEERNKDRFINAQLGLWNAMISIDGLFIGAAAVVVAINPGLKRWPFAVIICCSIVSLLCLVYNFYAVRETYYFLADSPDVNAMTEAEWAEYQREAREQDKKARNRHQHIRCSERLCLGLLVIVIAVFVYLVTRN